MITICLNDILKRINTLIFKFIWHGNGKGSERVKRNIMTQEYEKGGLKIIDVREMQKGLLLTWVHRLKDKTPAKWKYLPCHYLSKFQPDFGVFEYNTDNSNLHEKIILGKLPKRTSPNNKITKICPILMVI